MSLTLCGASRINKAVMRLCPSKDGFNFAYKITPASMSIMISETFIVRALFASTSTIWTRAVFN